MKPNKSIHLNEDTHLELSRIQFQLKEIGIEKTLYQIIDISIHHGIGNTFEFIKNSETFEGES